MSDRPVTASMTTAEELSVALSTSPNAGVPARPGDGDPRCAFDSIQLELKDIGQLFNSLDPSPFKERDLDRDAEEFIVGWARELHCATGDDVKLILHLQNPLPPDNTPCAWPGPVMNEPPESPPSEHAVVRVRLRIVSPVL